MKDDTTHSFRHSRDDAQTAKNIPDTPQTRAPAYRLAFLAVGIITLLSAFVFLHAHVIVV